MKKLLILLFSLFFLSSPSVFAEDISDFEIEGISIGDSLLDYMTEDEILEQIEEFKYEYSHLKEPNKYAEIYLWKDFPIYSGGISFFIKNNAVNQYIANKIEKYTILSMRGQIYYIEDFDSCIQKRDEIVEVLSRMFPNAEKTENTFEHPADPSGNSFLNRIYFSIDSETRVEATCNNWEETYRIKNNQNEGLSVAIKPKEIINWLSDY